MSQTEEAEGNKEALKATIRQQFDQAAQELGVGGYAIFGGFYENDSNARAATNRRTFRFNEKYLGIPQQEIERVLYHEAQHIEDALQLDAPFPDRELWRLFALHPLYLPIHARMLQHFNEHKSAGYPFKKTVESPPESIMDLGWANINYADPDELLALLRGYERFLKQGGETVGVSHEPYEFIPAFTPDNLNLLDLSFRHQLAQEVITSNPDVLKIPALPEIKISGI